MNELTRIQESSHYLATLLRRPAYAEWLWDRRNLFRRYGLVELYEELQSIVRKCSSFTDLQDTFREFKQRHFLRIGGRDLLGWADLLETTSQLSDLASVALQVGLRELYEHPQWWLDEALRDAWKNYRDKLELVIMGLGKLGGQELNYVSDIDILFLHALQESEEPLPPEHLVALSSLCQWMFRLMADQIDGDRVFQVDLRLRPRGKDGELVPSLSGAAEHYLLHGHSWERQMLLKARPVAGNRALGGAFLREVRPFVFRRFLDFQALDEIREMRDRILKEARGAHSNWKQFDVKLGVGGIREIEFIVQSFQLIYGGRHPELDEPNTLRCLDLLGKLKLLPKRVVEELWEAYIFLRRVEHWVQLDQNRQTQKLPQSGEARARLALALGFDGDEQKFLDELNCYCGSVHGHFLELFQSEPERKAHDPAAEAGRGESIDRFDQVPGFQGETYNHLREYIGVFSSEAQLDVLRGIEYFAQRKDPAAIERAIVRCERFFGQVRRRPGLTKAVSSSTPWLKSLCRILGQSQLVSDLLAHQPSLVEGLLDNSGILPAWELWEDSAGRLLSKHEDYEEGLEWVRRLKNERLLQLVLADLEGNLGQEDLEHELTGVANFVIRHTYDRVLQKVGLPSDLPLCVLALGKLGSREMGYLSDLDLVFVYAPLADEPQDQIPADLLRMIYRFMRMLSTPLNEGPGYPVDARLRPTGNYGPLIVTKKSWQEYYASRADLWEIQALLRLRAVAGNADLNRSIEAEARRICLKERNASDVWERLCHLRQRMQRERAQEGNHAIDLKLGAGGLADLEFLVQGHLLVSGYKCPIQETAPSTRSILASKLQEMLEIEVPVKDLVSAFDTFRSLENRLRLFSNLTSSRMSTAQFESLQVVGLWPPKAEHPAETWGDILRMRRHTRAFLNHWCPHLG